MDLLGRPVTVEPVRLSIAPVYLLGPGGRGKEVLAALRKRP